MYEYRKSLGGWSVDKKVGNHWIFYAKFSKKKDCLLYIQSKQNIENQLLINI